MGDSTQVMEGLLSWPLAVFHSSMSSAQCNSSPEFDWARNSFYQDCCTVASHLGGQCSPGQVFEIPAIDPSSVHAYTGPSVEQRDNMCLCSSVYYQLLQCCAVCQTASVLAWSLYKQNCTTVYFEVFEPEIPSGIRVFGWAYNNITATDGFNIDIVKSGTALPESTATTSPTTSPMVTNSTPPSTTPIGPIVGGSIGGLSLVIISCTFIFWCTRRSRRGRTVRYSYADSEQPPEVDIYTGYPIDPYTLKPVFVPSPPVTTTERDLVLPSLPVSAIPAHEVSPDELAITENHPVLPSPPVSATRPDASTQGVSPDELARRFDDLSRQFERLQSLVIPPTYESQ